METIFSNLGIGFQVALQPINVLWVTIGGILGTVIGMLPGIGPATGVAILLPLTFTMGPVGALITMAGVYYGAMFGGSRSSILLNTPGDGAAIASCFDGYPMAMSGRAESALAISAIASFIGGMIATIVMIFTAVPMSKLAILFGPAEYFLLMVFALSATASMSKGAMVKGFLSMVFGLMISTVGLDGLSGIPRFTFGIMELQSGVDFLIIIIGIYALGEVFKSFKMIHEGSRKMQTKFGKIWISREDWRRSWKPILRSTPIGFLVGALPGTGATVAALMSYNNEKNLSKHPEDFGKGAIEGLAAPEAANNAASVGALIPMLTLGIPGSGTTAVMMGALIMLGLQPGPLLFDKHPEIVWGLIASMVVGNIVCIIINLPLASLLVQILSIPARILFPLVLGLAFMGTYVISNLSSDLVILIIFGLIGLFMERGGIPTAPMILGGIVGGTMEQSFRQARIISNGNWNIFWGSPICVFLILLTVGFVVRPFILDFFKARRKTTTLSS